MRSAKTKAKQMKDEPDRQNRSDANRNIHAGLPKPSKLTLMLVQRNVPGGARKRQTLGSIKFGLDPLPIRTLLHYAKLLEKSTRQTRLALPANGALRAGRKWEATGTSSINTTST